MKRWFEQRRLAAWRAAALAAALCLTLAGCGGSPSNANSSAVPPDLTGEWVQADSEDTATYQTATITDDSITVRWVSDDTTALYWAGSFVPPTTPDEPYSWDSVRDTETDEDAVLSPTEDSKTFTYEDGYLSYTVSAMGVSTTIYLERQ